MLSVSDARARILSGLCPVGTEVVALSAAWNRVLASPVAARLTQPPADMSAMDGYAMRAADAVCGATLDIAGTAPAGHPFTGTLPQGHAIRLYTGSVMPDGTDCVVIQEDVDRFSGIDRDRIVLRAAGVPRRHVRPRGQDFGCGDIVLEAGRRLSARDIGLAAAANHPWLTVHRLPRIALLATGDEIVMPGETVEVGGIISSNTHALAALIRATGGEPVLLPLVRDDMDAIGAAADQMRGCDMLLTTGGASVGDHDLIQAALGRRGLALDFWKIAMRPGKPLIHGRLGDLPMLGLPGNPVSAIVCATLFLRPAIAILAGETPPPPATVQARLGAPLAANDGRHDFLRGQLTQGSEGGLVAIACADQASSLLAVLARADALILRPPHAPAAPAGTIVDIFRLADFGI